MKTKTVQQVDEELTKLRDVTLDSRRDSERWKLAWEKMDRLLEERFHLTVIASGE